MQAAAEAAGDLILAVRDRAGGGGVRVTHTPKGPVTAADVEADDLLRERLQRLDPTAAWLSEETADSPLRLSRSRVWVVDPLDGTAEFIAGGGHFGVSVALVEGEAPLLGVVHFPVPRLTYWAVLGGGAWRGSERLRVSERVRGLRMTARFADTRKRWLQEMMSGADPLTVHPVGSTVSKMARVSEGTSDAYASPSLTPCEWDICAAHLIVCEAGGRVTDLRGAVPRYNQEQVRGRHGVLVSNGHCHEALLARIQRTLEATGS